MTKMTTIVNAYMHLPRKLSYSTAVDRISKTTGISVKEVDRQVEQYMRSEVRKLGIKL